MDQNIFFCLLKTGLAGMPQSIEKDFYHDLPVPSIPLDLLSSSSSEKNNSLENLEKKSSSSNRLSDYQKNILMEWITNNCNNPYPNNTQKIELMRQTGLDRHRLNVWFTNHRIRGNFTFRQRRMDPLLLKKELLLIQTANKSKKKNKMFINEPPLNLNSNYSISSPVFQSPAIASRGSNHQVQFSLPMDTHP